MFLTPNTVTCDIIDCHRLDDDVAVSYGYLWRGKTLSGELIEHLLDVGGRRQVCHGRQSPPGPHTTLDIPNGLADVDTYTTLSVQINRRLAYRLTEFQLHFSLQTIKQTFFISFCVIKLSHICHSISGRSCLTVKYRHRIYGVHRAGIAWGLGVESWCLQSTNGNFWLKSVENFNPWAKLQTFRHLTPPPQFFYRSVPTVCVWWRPNYSN